MAGAIILGYIITVVVYSFFPLLTALLCTKTITAKKYRRICYIFNFILVVIDYSLGSQKYFNRNLLPCVLWTPVGIWLGSLILKRKGILLDETNDTEKMSNDLDVKTDTSNTANTNVPEYKYRCNNCGMLCLAWHETCPRCGAAGKMAETAPAQIQAAESSRTKQEKQTAPSTTVSMREIAPVARPNLVPSVSRNEEKSRNEKASSQIIICHYCGAVIPNGAKFCAQCGRAVAFVPVVKYCRFCGSKLTEGSMYCHNCGKEVQLNLGTPQMPQEDANEEKDSLDHKQQNGDDYTMPSYSTDSVLYKENKDYIDSLISEGRLSMKIALYVASDIVLIESGIKDIDLDHDLEVVLRELILEYGVFGTAARYGFVMGLFDQLGALSQEEVAEHKNRVLSLVRQELEQSKESKP